MALALFLTSSYCLAQERDCKSFMTGIFINVVGGNATGTIVQRDENFQIEIHEERG